MNKQITFKARWVGDLKLHGFILKDGNLFYRAINEKFQVRIFPALNLTEYLDEFLEPKFKVPAIDIGQSTCL